MGDIIWVLWFLVCQHSGVENISYIIFNIVYERYTSAKGHVKLYRHLKRTQYISHYSLEINHVNYVVTHK